MGRPEIARTNPILDNFGHKVDIASIVRCRHARVSEVRADRVLNSRIHSRFNMIRPYRGVLPRVASSAYIDPSAQVIGDAVIGERASVWPNATIRADVNSITIGDESNVQDNSCIHADEGPFAVILGKRVTVGHSVVAHGCVIEDECLIGIGAVILNGARIGRGSVVAAGTVVPEGMLIPAGSMVMGVPAKIRRDVTPEERERFRVNADHYVEACRIYREGLS